MRNAVDVSLPARIAHHIDITQKVYVLCAGKEANIYHSRKVAHPPNDSRRAPTFLSLFLRIAHGCTTSWESGICQERLRDPRNCSSSYVKAKGVIRQTCVVHGD
jgi:hypothetical protein